MQLIKPARLQPGQTIGLVAPSSPFDDSDTIQLAVESISALGFRVKLGQFVHQRNGYLAGSDPERAADLNAMFADPVVHGIIALRGGYGASRLLSLLDYALIRRNPKVLMGYSDITALLLAIHQQTGLVTFHGPVGDHNFTPYTLAEFNKVLCYPQIPVGLGAPPPPATGEAGRVQRENRVVTIVPGSARGPLMGGNLTLLTHLLGTPYFPDLAGKLLFLEDVGEAVYRLDRMLTQLWLAGHLAQVAGIVFGTFADCSAKYGSSTSRTLEEVLVERCRQLGIPALRGFMSGHVPEQTTLPIGCLAELDATAGTLTLLEAAVG
jgi:muramoyltetrapeptide carboxypeptidase